MRARRLLWLVLVALAVTAAGCVVASQYAAAMLAYQARLGVPVITVFGRPIYAPWSWLRWDGAFARYAPSVFAATRQIGWSTLLGVWLPVIIAILVMARRGQASTAHGSARWSTMRELDDAGLLSGHGVVLCQTSDARYLRRRGPSGPTFRMARRGRLITHAGPEHVIVFAPTRSGKGIGTVIPTLLSWRSSALVYDIKKELWTLTAGWRRQFSRCWRFEPTAPDSIRFNPLLEVRRGENEIRDTQNIADILVDPDGSEKRDHWKISAHTLLVGAILHCLYAERDKSLSGVARFLSNPDLPILETFQKMLATSHLPNGPHPVVAQCAREMLDKSDNELAGVISTAKTCVNLYNDSLIARNTSTSDFRIADLMHADDPVSLYLVVPPSDIDRTRPLIRLLLNQIGRRLTERMEFGDKPAYRHRLLFLLDEFPSLGRLSFFQTQLAYLAGYGIKAFLIAQSLNQLEAVYGQHNSILDNCHVRMTYTALDDRTAKRISDLLGQATQMKRQRSFSGSRLFRNVTESEQEHGRPLLTPDEILRLPYEDALLLVGGVAPYRARKVMYFLDPRFKAHTKLAPPDSIRRRQAELFGGRVPSDWETRNAPASGRSSDPVIVLGRAPARPLASRRSTSRQPVPNTAAVPAEGASAPISIDSFAAFFGSDSHNEAPTEGSNASPQADRRPPDEELPL
jgi:type IV secretion system protein VirD4